MGQYLPIVALVVLAVVFAALSRVASQLLAPSATTIAKRSPYECGIVPGPRAARALPGALLPGRDDLHRLRHRDHLPLPVGGHLPGARRLRPRRDRCIFAVAVFVSFVYLISNGALDWGPVKRLRRLVADGRRRAHDRAPRSGGSASRAASAPEPTDEAAAA